MKLSLLITTYERPDALAVLLRSVAGQTVAPHEIVVGDDGSGPATREVIEQAVSDGLAITHAWRPHDGFRAGRARNSSVAVATGDYLVMIDDDIWLHPGFIADHRNAAKRGFFVQGSRVLLGEQATAQVLTGKRTEWPSLFAPDIANRKNLLRLPWLSALVSREVRGIAGVRSCNFAVWKDDFYRVNGFNEDFVGWGREDSEFVVRLLNAGVRRKNIRHAALCCHLHHPPRSREALPANDGLLARTQSSGIVRCENGLNLHLTGDGQPPVNE